MGSVNNVDSFPATMALKKPLQMIRGKHTLSCFSNTVPLAPQRTNRALMLWNAKAVFSFGGFSQWTFEQVKVTPAGNGPELEG